MVDSKVENIYQNTIKNGWIFNIRFNIYIYNSLEGFTKTKNNDKNIKIKTIPFTIQIYSQIIINIINLNRMKPLIFYNIIYILGFFINLISAK